MKVIDEKKLEEWIDDKLQSCGKHLKYLHSPEVISKEESAPKQFTETEAKRREEKAKQDVLSELRKFLEWEKMLPTK